MIGQHAIFSRNNDEWETPQALFDELDREFHFNLDPCATDENHKCDYYYTIADNGLDNNWGGVIFFVIPRTVRLLDGLKNAIEKDRKITLLW